MDGETYRTLLQRIDGTMTSLELDALAAHLLECYVDSQRRRALLMCIDERRRDLERGTEPVAG